MPNPSRPPSRSPAYLDALPEQLVIRGLRAWMFGFEFNDTSCILEAVDLYEEAIGGRDGACCNALLGRWARQLWREAPRKLAVYPTCCKFMTRDECMAAGLIAALQCQDLAAARIASTLLLRRDGASNLHGHMAAAADFACSLKKCDLYLAPVPSAVVEQIAQLSAGASQTRH